MKRRDVLVLGAATAAWPAIARAQAPGQLQRVGILMESTDREPVAHENLATFVAAFRALGWSEGLNLRLDIRWAGENSTNFEGAAAELLALGPDVVVAATSPAVAALRKRTTTVPIVFVIVTDPVGQGFVSNLSRPQGNITGFSNYDAPMTGKWLSLLKEISPEVKTVGLLLNPDTARYAPLLQHELEGAGAALGLRVAAASVRSDDEIDDAFAKLAAAPGSGMVVGPDSFTTAHRDRIIAAAARSRVPAIYPYRHFADRGGLVGYGIVVSDLFRRAAPYVDRILRGAKPSELPVQAPAQFELAINLKTAKALGLTVPQSILLSADEVIE